MAQEVIQNPPRSLWELCQVMKPMEAINSVEYLLSDINEALQEKIDQIQAVAVGAAHRLLTDYYAIGLIIQEIYDDQQGDSWKSRYGNNAMKKVEAGYGLVQVVPVRGKELRRSVHPRGGRTHRPAEDEERQAHYVVPPATHCADSGRKIREELLERTLEKDWSCDELGDATKAALNAVSRSKPKRGVAGPRKLGGMIEQQDAYAKRFLEQAERVWDDAEHSLASLFFEQPMEKHSEAEGERLKEVTDRLRQLARVAGEKADEAEKVYTRYMRQLDRQKANAKAEAEAEEDDEEASVWFPADFDAAETLRKYAATEEPDDGAVDVDSLHAAGQGKNAAEVVEQQEEETAERPEEELEPVQTNKRAAAEKTPEQSEEEALAGDAVDKKPAKRRSASKRRKQSKVAPTATPAETVHGEASAR